ncbi:MAG: zinc metallopeptidase [Acidobacteria bacterium]|nr:zinc metallopeptidase [Acidobacteriota bacterium]MCA1639850.1 zinc metallopeptidase [Acidobacteriota bacterium]
MLRGRESTNVEDQRGMGGRGLALGGGGIGTLLLILAVWLCGGDPRALLDQLGGGTAPSSQTQQAPQGQPNARNDDQAGFVKSVLGSTEDVWRKILPQQAGKQYQDPRLVLFTGQVASACGYASSATGPFYCPGDNKLYLDFGFFNDLKNEFRAPGDFAQAYVIAHEVGHHIQNQLGTMGKVQAAGNSNEMSVRLELQADCYAGVWANYAQKQGLVEAGDAEEAIRAAQAVGDDAIQKRAQGYVVPESFTHGSAQQRMQWFTRGFQNGDMRQCNTFGR